MNAINQAAQTIDQVPKSNSLKARKSPTPQQRRCDFCRKKYSGVGQSNYCSKSCNEKAFRRRKDELVETLADILLSHSEALNHEIALAVSKRTVRAMYAVTKFNVMALGYQYDEVGKRWRLQSRLHA